MLCSACPKMENAHKQIEIAIQVSSPFYLPLHLPLPDYPSRLSLQPVDNHTPPTTPQWQTHDDELHFRQHTAIRQRSRSSYTLWRNSPLSTIWNWGDIAAFQTTCRDPTMRSHLVYTMENCHYSQSGSSDLAAVQAACSDSTMPSAPRANHGKFATIHDLELVT